MFGISKKAIGITENNRRRLIIIEIKISNKKRYQCSERTLTEIVNAMKKRVVTMHDGVIISDEKEGGYHEA